jgi:hypothetical protein
MMPMDTVVDDPNVELRHNPRADLFQEISIAGGGVVSRSQVADLSIGGMFVDVFRAPFPPGSRVTVRFPLQSGATALVLECEVLYLQPGIGVGLRFVDPPETARRKIRDYVEEATHLKKAGAPPVRKSARVSVNVPVRVRGVRGQEPPFEEPARIVTLSKHGACLVADHAVDVGMKIVVETKAGREFRGSVVWIGTVATRSEGQVGLRCRGLAQSLGFQFP